MDKIKEKFYKTFGIKKKKEYGCTDTWEICYHQEEYPNCKGCPFWELIDIKYPEIENMFNENIKRMKKHKNELERKD